MFEKPLKFRRKIFFSVHRCSGCGMVCHEKCSVVVSSICPNIEERRLVVATKCDLPSAKRSATYAGRVFFVRIIRF